MTLRTQMLRVFQQEDINFLLTNRLPRRLLTHFIGWFSRIERAPIQDQKVFLDRPYCRWIIRLNWPSSGEIAFGAVGFTLTLLAEPVLTDKQSLSRHERTRLAGA